MDTDAQIMREFDELLFSYKLGMVLLGIWPPDRKASWLRILGWKIQLYIVYFSMSFLLCVQSVEIYCLWGSNGSEISLYNALSLFVVIVKLGSFLKRMENIREILQTMRTNWLRVMRETVSDNRDLMYRTIMRARSCSNKYFLLLIAMAMLLIAMPFIRDTSLQDLENPFFGKCCSARHLSEILTGTITSLANWVTDTVFLLCTYHLCARLRILQNDLMDFGCKGYLDEHSHLVRLIKRHQSEIRSAQALQLIFSQSSMQQLLISCLMICLNGFKLIVSLRDQHINSITYLVHLIFALLQMLCYCQPGNELIVQSQSLDHAIYHSAWISLDKRSVKDLTFMMQRSQKPLALTAGKICVLSLQNFMRVIKTSLSVLSVLLAIHRRDD